MVLKPEKYACDDGGRKDEAYQVLCAIVWVANDAESQLLEARLMNEKVELRMMVVKERGVAESGSRIFESESKELAILREKSRISPDRGLFSADALPIQQRALL